MRKFFNHEGGVWKFFGRLGDLIMLNILFLICCAPIVTIGAAKTALYAVTKKMAKNEEGYIIRGFLSQFAENFKRSTAIWIIYVAACILPIADLYVCSLMGDSAFTTFCRSMMMLTLLVFTIVMLYALVLQSTFENTLKNTMKNGLLMGIGHFPQTLLILLVEFSPVVAVFLLGQYVGALFTLILTLWFALAAYINSFIFNKIFEKFM